MIYFDNAATTYPKPNGVLNAVREALLFYGANPGRAGHKMAYDTAEKCLKFVTLFQKFSACTRRNG